MIGTALVTLFLVGLVPLAPTEPVLIGMGVFAATGRVPLVAVIVTAAVACALSDHLLYVVGRVAGIRALRRFAGRPTVTAAHEWLSRWITRWGAPVLVVGRWLPAGGTIGAVLTGTLRWRLARFSPASVLGSALWSTYVALIGYFGGTVIGRPVVGLLVSLGVAAVLGVLSGVVVRWARGSHARSSTSAVADQPSRALGRAGAQPVAARKRALLTRRERVSDVSRSPNSSPALPGSRTHGSTPAAAASASPYSRFVNGSSSTTLNVPAGAVSAATTAVPASIRWIEER